MSANTIHSKAEKAGRWLGRAWMAIARLERRLAGWLLKQGATSSVATASIWAIRLICVVVVLSISVTFALLLAALLIVAIAVSRSGASIDEDQAEWRDGLLGFGLYDLDGHRIDPHDPNEEP